MYHGRYGNLSTLEAAKAALYDIEKNVDPREFEKWKDLSLPNDVRYMSMRLVRQIEGLQRVIVLNGGDFFGSNLPMFYKKENDSTSPFYIWTPTKKDKEKNYGV